VYNVLFLSTGNSARSILAESLLNSRNNGRFRAFSAGVHPNGVVHPAAVALLQRIGLPTQNLRSKSWNEFASPGAPVLDFIITVCDKAARQTCPRWPGRPVTSHWDIPDPLDVTGSEFRTMNAFRDATWLLSHHIEVLLDVPLRR
jgi:arsenate reductase